MTANPVDPFSPFSTTLKVFDSVRSLVLRSTDDRMRTLTGRQELAADISTLCEEWARQLIAAIQASEDLVTAGNAVQGFQALTRYIDERENLAYTDLEQGSPILAQLRKEEEFRPLVTAIARFYKKAIDVKHFAWNAIEEQTREAERKPPRPLVQRMSDKVRELRSAIDMVRRQHAIVRTAHLPK